MLVKGLQFKLHTLPNLALPLHLPGMAALPIE